MDRAQIQKILEKHKQLNFVQRVLKPEDWPDTDLGYGMRGTHLMSWGEQDGKYMVFPSLVYDDQTRSLKHLGVQAMKHAIETGEFIEFKTAEEADKFSKLYKKVWEQPKQPVRQPQPRINKVRSN